MAEIQESFGKWHVAGPDEDSEGHMAGLDEDSESFQTVLKDQEMLKFRDQHIHG